MKNPLRKRYLRELRGDPGKYLAIFFLMTALIGFISGFLVADESLILAYNEGFEKYQIEDGYFGAKEKINRAQKNAIEENGVTLYDNFYVETELENGSTLRIYAEREEINLICLMEGAMPQGEGEIAVDRMYADNNALGVGDVISDGGESWTITGLVALPDYSCLFSDNDDTMFDALTFGVAVVDAGSFQAFDETRLHYIYSWKYEETPLTETEEKERGEELLRAVVAEISLESFVPRYQNQAITFTGEDMGSDKAMMMVILYMIIVIIAFVFAVTTSNTIAKEANVIGTLRASGYTRGELVRHYLTMPILVTLAAAVVGNILGYTVFKDVCAALYYGSYSLPTYETVWSAEAFWETTAIPAVIMVVVNLAILTDRLRLEPLKFLRRDLKRRKQKRVLGLNPLIPFFTRFRMRVILQNMGSYAVMLAGILFANMLLMFGLLLPSVLDHYQDMLAQNMLANYQYFLSVPLDATDEEHKLESAVAMLLFQDAVETETEGAEKFSAYSLETFGEGVSEESVTFYGIEGDSRYLPLGLTDGDVYISSAFAQKRDLAVGDTFCLKEKYEETVYEFRVTGIYDYMGGLSVFMEREALNRTFELGDGYYCGYFSDEEITDIDEEYIGSVVDLEALTKVSRQLDHSMGGIMYLVDGFAVVIFLVLIYLLSKIIIEKNGQAISLAKILGYTNGEISRLYIVSTSVMVVLFILVSIPLEDQFMQIVLRIMLSQMSGWIPYYLAPEIPVKVVALGVGAYAAVAFLEYGKIKKTPMDEALKVVE